MIPLSLCGGLVGGVGGVCRVIFMSNPTTVLRLCCVVLSLGLWQFQNVVESNLIRKISCINTAFPVHPWNMKPDRQVWCLFHSNIIILTPACHSTHLLAAISAGITMMTPPCTWQYIAWYLWYLKLLISNWCGGWLGGWFQLHNIATSWLHLASWNLPDFQHSW